MGGNGTGGAPPVQNPSTLHDVALLQRHTWNRWVESGSRPAAPPAYATQGRERACMSKARPRRSVALYSFPFEQIRAPQGRDEVTFHAGEVLFNNGLPGHQYDLHGLRNPMLIQAKRLTQQAAGTRTHHRSSDFSTGNDAQPRTGSQNVDPIQHEASDCKSLSRCARALEVPPARDAPLARQPQRTGRRAHTQVPTGVRRLRPTRRRFFKMARPLFVEFRLRNPCWRLRRIFDG